MNIVILSAGQGKRMKSKLAKVMVPILGKPMLSYVLDSVQMAFPDGNITVVVGDKKEQLEEYLADKNVNVAIQAEQNGTADAVKASLSFLSDEDTLIISGDTPLILPETLANIYENYLEQSADLCVISSVLENPFGYGRIVRELNLIKEIVEEKDACERIKLIEEVNSGIYFFKTDLLKGALANIENKNAQGEFYLTDAVLYARQNGKRVIAIEAEAEETFGCNNREQVYKASKVLQKRIIKKHFENGASFLQPKTCIVESDVQLEQDVTVGPNCHLQGKTIIGEGTYITNTTVIDGEIGKDCTIGPFAYIRPGSKIGDNIKIGDFVEIKNSNIGNGTKVPHLSYVGDADVGEKCNFGCGSIVVNYDGRKKYRSIIGNDVFIGCNANLVSPVELEDNSFIAAGATVTKKVPSYALAINRMPQENKLDWVKKRKKS